MFVISMVLFGLATGGSWWALEQGAPAIVIVTLISALMSMSTTALISRLWNERNGNRNRNNNRNHGGNNRQNYGGNNNRQNYGGNNNRQEYGGNNRQNYNNNGRNNDRERQYNNYN